MFLCIFSVDEDKECFILKLEEKIREVVEAPLDSKGYDLLRVNVIGGRKKLTVGVDIDRLDGKNVTIDDCVEASHLISAILDVEDFINGAYNLEVSSPGESRPLAKIRDFERFCGCVAKMELVDPVEGMRKITGRIVGVDGTKGSVKVEILGENDRQVSLFVNNVKRANVKREF